MKKITFKKSTQNYFINGLLFFSQKCISAVVLSFSGILITFIPDLGQKVSRQKKERMKKV